VGFCVFFFLSKLLAASFLSCSLLYGKTQKLRSPHSSSPHYQPPTNKIQTTQRERNPTEKNLEKKKKKKRWTLQLENFVFLNLQDDDHQHIWVAKLLKQTMIQQEEALLQQISIHSSLQQEST
jgi:hypothetical protein